MISWALSCINASSINAFCSPSMPWNHPPRRTDMPMLGDCFALVNIRPALHLRLFWPAHIALVCYAVPNKRIWGTGQTFTFPNRIFTCFGLNSYQFPYINQVARYSKLKGDHSAKLHGGAFENKPESSSSYKIIVFTCHSLIVIIFVDTP